MSFGFSTRCALEMIVPGIAKEMFTEAVAPKYRSVPELSFAVASFSIGEGSTKQGLKNNML